VATLGPAGTNHELVTRRYLTQLGVLDFDLQLLLSFAEAASRLKAGTVDYIVQCAVHPATPQTLGANFRDMYAIDCFISDSKPLAILSRSDVAQPRSIGVLLPANADYTDLSRWERQVSVPSLPLILELLLAGDVDSGLVYLEYATQYPEQLRVEEVIGSPDDVWIVYGPRRASQGRLVHALDSPGARDIRTRAGLTPAAPASARSA
jgi:hypothetical protein